MSLVSVNCRGFISVVALSFLGSSGVSVVRFRRVVGLLLLLLAIGGFDGGDFDSCNDAGRESKRFEHLVFVLGFLGFANLINNHD